MPNPFNKAQQKEQEENPEIIVEGVEGHFGCFESGCGKVVGNAVYNNDAELLYFTCPDGHKNTVSIKL